MDKLRLWADLSDSGLVDRIVAAEIRDLANGDIPYFTVAPRSTEIESPSNGRIGRSFGRTPYERAVSGLSRSDSARAGLQVKVIDAALRYPPDGERHFPADEQGAGRAEESAYALARFHAESCLASISAQKRKSH